jgi:hypothetical protein
VLTRSGQKRRKKEAIGLLTAQFSLFLIIVQRACGSSPPNTVMCWRGGVLQNWSMLDWESVPWP